ncbi:hypothetical protein AGMMS49574_25640 [Bacteroidia bacterium]|nr:hypothetical protein AGMMS49574_25640 [Bacteroidia bacterium]
MRKCMLFALCSFLIVSLNSCGDDSNEPDLSETRTVTVKITGSANLVIQSVIINNGTGEMQDYSDLSVNSWTKEISYKVAMGAGATGSTTDGENGSMKIQLLDGNKVLKESTAEGKTLSTDVAYVNQ